MNAVFPMSVRVLLLAVLVVCGVTLGRTGAAHEAGAAYVRLRVEGASIVGEVDVARRDALLMLSLSPELGDEQAMPLIASKGRALVLGVGEALQIRAQGTRCASEVPEPAIGPPRDPGIVLVKLVARCRAPIRSVSLRYSPSFDGDASRRAFVGLVDGNVTHSAILGRDRSEATFALERSGVFAHFTAYLCEGVHHVASGFDHLLFLAALLLPAVAIRSKEGFAPRESARLVLVEVALVASAFTVAHSITLCASALDLVRPPRRWVEAAIALTVVVAALNNLGPILRVRGWQLAFGLGLVHGFGFAAQLGILRLGPSSRAVALAGFNAGVEVGQLAVIALCLPPLLALRRTRFYRVGVLQVPSLMIAWIAGVWFFERTFGVTLLG